MLNSGKLKVMDIARIMGHTSPQMLMTKYARYIKSEQIKAIDSNIPYFMRFNGQLWTVLEEVGL